MEETAKNILLWHMALQLPYVPVFTKIGTTAHDGQLRLPKTQRGLCRESERKRGEKASLPQTSALMSFCNSHSTIKSELASARGEKIWARGEIGARDASFTHPHFPCTYSTFRPFSLCVHSALL